MLSLDHISVQFGGRYLFDDLSLMVGPHDRIGLVGSNGAGKTTLLKIIAGLSQAEEGTVSKAHYVTAGYLPQDGVTAVGKTLYKEVETAFENILLVQQELEEAHLLLSTQDTSSQEYMETLEIYGELQHKLEDLDAFRIRRPAAPLHVGQDVPQFGLGFAFRARPQRFGFPFAIGGESEGVVRPPIGASVWVDSPCRLPSHYCPFPLSLAARRSLSRAG